MIWSLVTGGTGTIGSRLVLRLLKAKKRVRIFSRDEGKQVELEERLLRAGFPKERFRMFIGDVRDSDRLTRAMQGVSEVFHAAALKHVVSCEYNPSEAVETNIKGIQNLVKAASAAGVKSVVNMSSDKAAEPNNLMGATKLVGERIITQANAYGGGCRFMSLRFGNVMGSRGSVLPRWTESAKSEGLIRITNPRMTRFVMSIDEAVDLTLRASEEGAGGEIFIKDMLAVQLGVLAETWVKRWESFYNGKLKTIEIGSREGETLHEQLITTEEVHRTIMCNGFFVITPNIIFKSVNYDHYVPDMCLADAYSSGGAKMLDAAEIRELLPAWEKP